MSSYKLKNKRCLGIDPGVANTGYAVIHRSQQYKLVAAGTIRTRAAAGFGARLLVISEEIRDLIHKHDVECVSIEKVFHNRNVSSSMSTAGVIAVCAVEAARLDIQFVDVTPQQAKAVTGLGGQVTKKPLKAQMAKILSCEFSSSHAADAAAIAIAGLLQLK